MIQPIFMCFIIAHNMKQHYLSLLLPPQGVGAVAVFPAGPEPQHAVLQRPAHACVRRGDPARAPGVGGGAGGEGAGPGGLLLLSCP